MQPFARYRLLCIEMYKNNTICKNWCVLMCFYNNTSILLYVLSWQVGGGGYSPPSPPLNPPLHWLQVAVKTLHKDAMVHGQKEFLREADIMRGLDHHCIVKLLGVVLGKNMMLVCAVWWVWVLYIITFCYRFRN